MSELQEKIRAIVEGEPVVLFMKGTPDWIACGNSGRALEALRSVGAPVTAVDILPDPQIRQELTGLYGWPTIPQVFVKGELIGGADIVQELAESGELEGEISARLGDGWKAPGDEKVVSVADGGPGLRVI
ncbi:MAG: glutaredoxin domain-containing protein [Thermoleophilia bacterium]